MGFNENWYSEDQTHFLAMLARLAKPLKGAVIEFGCWEGKSTCVLANAVWPDAVIAVDTWKGNIDESPDHVSVASAKERDVLSTFKKNVQTMTKGNVETVVSDCHRFMESYGQPIKLCHIDACHDYNSVRRSITAVLPLLVRGGLLCGDDIATAHKFRVDLDGGVERAVTECLPGFQTRGNIWYWTKGPKHED